MVPQGLLSTMVTKWVRSCVTGSASVYRRSVLGPAPASASYRVSALAAAWAAVVRAVLWGSVSVQAMALLL